MTRRLFRPRFFPKGRSSGVVVVLATVALAVAFLAAGCSKGAKRLNKDPGSALWLASGAELTFGEIDELREVGVSELFVEAGRLGWEGSAPRIQTQPMLSMPRRAGMTLVVSGGWFVGDLEPEAAATALWNELARLEGEARRQNVEAVGFHFDVNASGALESYAATLSALQSELPDDLFLSATVARSWIGREGLAEVAAAVDFVVPFLYGQRPGEGMDISDAWDLQEVEATLRSLGELDRDYMLAVVTLGRVIHLGGDGTWKGESFEIPVSALVDNRALELASGFSLEGIDRLVYTFHAKGRTRVGEWEVEPGDQLRAVRLSGYHLEELERQASAFGLEHYLGTLYYRLAGADERMAVDRESLVAALGPEPVVARPEAHLEEAGRGRVRVVLENAGPEATDLLPIGRYNFVELEVKGGTFGKVDAGDFARYDILRRDEKGEVVRAFRNVPIVHLYTPILESGERMESGPIEVNGVGLDAVKVTGQFVVPGGTTVPVVKPDPESEGDGEAETPE